MKIDPTESFIRWQAATREHFTTTSSVVLGLATGLLAFVVNRFLTDKPTGRWLFWFAAGSLVLSIVSALWCSINRLKDFRATAQIARNRAKQVAVSEADLLETKALGNISWRLFRFQLVSFGVGAIASIVALIVK